MKYIAPVDTDDPPTRMTNTPEGDGLDWEMVELSGVRPARGRIGSARWLGLSIGLAVALIGYGFCGQVLGPPNQGPVMATGETGQGVVTATSAAVSAAGSDSPIAEADDRPMIVTAPAEGATVTGGITVTGGVVVVDATARRALGTIHASVSIGDAVLGCRDVSVDAAGPIEVRIPVFPPAFDAPVVLHLDSEPIGGRSGLAFSRNLRLDIPSVVGIWDAPPTLSVDRTDRVLMSIHGYAPRASRTVKIAVQNVLGDVAAIATVPISDDGGCPGSIGGRIFGLGSFVVRLWLPAGSTGRWTLGARWRDAATGHELHFETALSPAQETIGNSRRGR